MPKLNSLKIDALKRTAAHFKVDLVGDDPTKDQIIAALTDADVDYEKYEAAIFEATEQDEVLEFEVVEVTEDEVIVEAPEFIVVKFTGRNKLYSVGGVRFSRERPLIKVERVQAEELISNDPSKFKLATKREILEILG